MTHRSGFQSKNDKKGRFHHRAITWVFGLLFTALFLPGPYGKTLRAEETRPAVKHDAGNFPLTGLHRGVACAECHHHGVLKGTPRQCEICHWKRKQDPPHGLRFGLHCDECHTTFSWSRIKHGAWDHESKTGYRLQGAHRTADCTQCHRDGGYNAVSSDCASCHEAEYRAAKNPDHLASAFPLTCEACHTSQTTWDQAVYAHDIFKLRGAHLTAACDDCHGGGRYASLPSDCVSCHLDDYNNAKDPDHKKLNFSTDCRQCHGDAAVNWEAGDIAHDPYWPLKGNHRTIDCSECHTTTATPSRDCITCHRDDYESVQDPNHKELGFSTDCVVCHGDGAQSWDNATVNHDSFWPLEGAHRGLDCDACHAGNPNPPRDCYACHRDDYNSAEDPDHQAAGFPTDCAICHHPAHVDWHQAVFSHSFPINLGKHAPLDCSDCHLTANYQQFSCLDCHAHGKIRMDKEHDEVGGYSYNSQACYSCHPTGTE